MFGDDLDGFALIDWERSACLCDVGAPGNSVAVAVTADGRDVFWLVDEAELHAEHPRHGNADQPHEWTGPLPDRWRHRIAAAPFRCGRPRADGRPCRQAVKAAGRPCCWHAQRASAS
jgi:hypothetical protein